MVLLSGIVLIVFAPLIVRFDIELSRSEATRQLISDRRENINSIDSNITALEKSIEDNFLGIMGSLDNAGASWNASRIKPISMFDVDIAVDGRAGIAVGENGTVLTTHDGGASWMTRNRKTSHNLLSVALTADGDAGVAVGVNGTVLTTHDGGISWRTRNSNNTSTLFGVALAADGKGRYRGR